MTTFIIKIMHFRQSYAETQRHGQKCRNQTDKQITGSTGRRRERYTDTQMH